MSSYSPSATGVGIRDGDSILESLSTLTIFERGVYFNTLAHVVGLFGSEDRNTKFVAANRNLLLPSQTLLYTARKFTAPYEQLFCRMKVL